MALQSQIEDAARSQTTPTGGGGKFTDVALVPDTLAECAIPSEEITLVLRYLARIAGGDEILHLTLLAEILGE